MVHGSTGSPRTGTILKYPIKSYRYKITNKINVIYIIDFIVFFIRACKDPLLISPLKRGRVAPPNLLIKRVPAYKKGAHPTPLVYRPEARGGVV